VPHLNRVSDGYEPVHLLLIILDYDPGRWWPVQPGASRETPSVYLTRRLQLLQKSTTYYVGRSCKGREKGQNPRGGFRRSIPDVVTGCEGVDATHSTARGPLRATLQRSASEAAKASKPSEISHGSRLSDLGGLV